MSGKLAVVQSSILPVQLHQGIVIAYFLDVTVFHVQDGIGIPDR